jgi:hypothetical protein
VVARAERGLSSNGEQVRYIGVEVPHDAAAIAYARRNSTLRIRGRRHGIVES